MLKVDQKGSAVVLRGTDVARGIMQVSKKDLIRRVSLVSTVEGVNTSVGTAIDSLIHSEKSGHRPVSA